MVTNAKLHFIYSEANLREPKTSEEIKKMADKQLRGGFRWVGNTVYGIEYFWKDTNDDVAYFLLIN